MVDFTEPQSTRPTIVIERDITIIDVDGKSWISDSSATAATNDEVLLLHPDDAATFLQALGPQKANAFRNDYLIPVAEITLKISRLTLNCDKSVIAIGSAHPRCRWDGCELDLIMNLTHAGKIGTCSTFDKDLALSTHSHILAKAINRVMYTSDRPRPAAHTGVPSSTPK